MSKVMIEVDVKQAENIIRQLSVREKQLLLDKLVEEEFDKTVKKLRRNMRNQKFSPGEVENIVNEARKDYYAKSCS